jgi:hypothetical protein
VGRFRELDNKENTIGSRGTRFKSGISQVLWTSPVFELSGLKEKSMSCKSTQNRRSRTGFDSLGSLMSTRNKGNTRHPRVTCPTLQQTRQRPLEDDLCLSRDMERRFAPSCTRYVDFGGVTLPRRVSWSSESADEILGRVLISHLSTFNPRDGASPFEVTGLANVKINVIGCGYGRAERRLYGPL